MNNIFDTIIADETQADHEMNLSHELEQGDKNYRLILISSFETPDWDYTIVASSREEAIERFYDLLRREYSRKWIGEHIREEE